MLIEYLFQSGRNRYWHHCVLLATVCTADTEGRAAHEELDELPAFEREPAVPH